MRKRHAEDRYLETEILSSSREELVLKVFDGLIQFSRIAIDRLEKDPSDIQTIHANLLKAQRACAILMGSLNFEVAPELSKNLFAIYEFWHHELTAANLRQDATRVEQLLPDFIEYRKTWCDIVELNRMASAKKKVATGEPQFRRLSS
jgi:flagellar protein FliS